MTCDCTCGNCDGVDCCCANPENTDIITTPAEEASSPSGECPKCGTTWTQQNASVKVTAPPASKGDT